VKSIRDNSQNQMLDRVVVERLVGIVMVAVAAAAVAAALKRVHRDRQMLLGHMVFSRDLGPCMDFETDRLYPVPVARQLRLREECSMGRVSL